MDKGRTHLEFVLVSADILDDTEMIFWVWFYFLRLQYGGLPWHAQKLRLYTPKRRSSAFHIGGVTVYLDIIQGFCASALKSPWFVFTADTWKWSVLCRWDIAETFRHVIAAATKTVPSETL